MSPRSFDSGEVARSSGLMLRFTENVDCPICRATFAAVFHDLTGSMTVEDITDPPVGEHRCPECGHRWASELTGWTFYTEAG